MATKNFRRFIVEGDVANGRLTLSLRSLVLSKNNLSSAEQDGVHQANGKFAGPGPRVVVALEHVGKAVVGILFPWNFRAEAVELVQIELGSSEENGKFVVGKKIIFR